MLSSCNSEDSNHGLEVEASGDHFVDADGVVVGPAFNVREAESPWSARSRAGRTNQKPRAAPADMAGAARQQMSYRCGWAKTTVDF